MDRQDASTAAGDPAGMYRSALISKTPIVRHAWYFIRCWIDALKAQI
jgi:hypothetical protein